MHSKHTKGLHKGRINNQASTYRQKRPDNREEAGRGGGEAQKKGKGLKKKKADEWNGLTSEGAVF